MTKVTQTPVTANTAGMITQYNSAAAERLRARLAGNSALADLAHQKMQLLQARITREKRR